MLIKEYNDKVYEIVIYTTGGSVRDRLSGELVAGFTNFWTEDESIHEKTKEQLELIYKKFGIIIDYKNFRELFNKK